MEILENTTVKKKQSMTKKKFAKEIKKDYIYVIEKAIKKYYKTRKYLKRK